MKPNKNVCRRKKDQLIFKAQQQKFCHAKQKSTFYKKKSVVDLSDGAKIFPAFHIEQRGTCRLISQFTLVQNLLTKNEPQRSLQ